MGPCPPTGQTLDAGLSCSAGQWQLFATSIDHSYLEGFNSHLHTEVDFWWDAMAAPDPCEVVRCLVPRVLPCNTNHDYLYNFNQGHYYCLDVVSAHEQFHVDTFHDDWWLPRAFDPTVEYIASLHDYFNCDTGFSWTMTHDGVVGHYRPFVKAYCDGKTNDAFAAYTHDTVCDGVTVSETDAYDTTDIILDWLVDDIRTNLGLTC